MSTFTQIYYHLVFSTKNRDRCLHADRRPDLFRYIWGILEKRHCHLYQINGVEDHLHLFIGLHPTFPLSDCIKEIKTATAGWIKANGVFKGFSNWQEGYAAFTQSHAEKSRLVEYVKNQEEHHRVRPFMEELRALLVEAGIEWEEKYLL